jgi:hypothetical protein
MEKAVSAILRRKMTLRCINLSFHAWLFGGLTKATAKWDERKSKAL